MVNPVDSLTVKTILLSLVNEQVTQPSINLCNEDQEQQSRPDTGRTLSFKYEALIAQHLAFVASYSDGALHVLAVCVEEVEKPSSENGGYKGLVIRFAVNTGKHEVLQERLLGLAGVLRDEASGNANRSANYDTLFDAVIALNRMRILSRLRSQHATSRKAKDRRSLLSRLQKAKYLLSNSTSISPTRFRSLASDVEALQEIFDRLEGMDPVDVRSSRSEIYLRDLVRGIHSFLQQYERDLRLIPYRPGDWDENATDAVIDRLGKVGQYVVSCDDLLRAARRYRELFSNIGVEFVDLQQAGRRFSVSGTVDETIDASCSKELLSRVSKHSGKSVSDMRECIKAQMRKNSKSRLHAEIQLVLYYERDTRAILFRPRVIASSKMACYLCDLFLKIHGQFFIPGTHGKLYNTWKWPAPIQLPETIGHDGRVDLQHILPGFSNAIDRKLRDCLDGARRVMGPDRPESRIDLLAAMTPSIRSSVSQRPQELGGNSHATGTGPCYRPSSTCTRAKPVERPVSLSQTRSLGNMDLQKSVLRLQAGEVAYSALDTGSPFIQILVPGLRVDLEYDISSSSRAPDNCSGSQDSPYISGEGSLRMEVEYLPSQRDSSPDQIVDLEGVSSVEKSAPDGVLFSSEGLLLKKKSTLLRLRARLI